MTKDIAGTRPRRGHWVQTERAAHEAWASLIGRKPKAAILLHHLVAKMGHQNAVVVPQKVLAALVGCSVDTIQRSLQVLEAERWIQIVRIGKGKEAAYVINDRVAWGQPRDQLRLSSFSATVIADADDQGPIALAAEPLQRIPALFAGEQQLPHGDGLPPPSQPSMPGMEPDLPTMHTESPDPWADERAEFARRDAAGLPRVLVIPTDEPTRDPDTLDWVNGSTDAEG